MSTAFRNRVIDGKARASGSNAASVPGAGWFAPWVLRPKRGLPQHSHTTLQPCPACKCCAVWRWREHSALAQIPAPHPPEFRPIFSERSIPDSGRGQSPPLIPRMAARPP